MTETLLDLVSPDALGRVVELTRRSAADDASAALRDALALAGAEVLGGREIELLFELLECTDHQSGCLSERMHQLQGCSRVAIGAGHEPSRVRETLRADLAVMRSRLKRLHIAAGLAEALAYAGSEAPAAACRCSRRGLLNSSKRSPTARRW